ncbi:hypothetical protein JKP75_18870 [Blastococcus sp. TML/M2B]|uniref:hypothetical protein n=1 Tax=unclassified Blastococcus TaxID=2619396 RepID=UPI00190DB5B5|nr:MULTISPECIES: hypothetical protein [unclassified Blastococcus]MBN1094423.1 hypothetical protein [Blastococcus sp. TML/M2B]MBN1095384.1 hypothetical protein [Blastococcus sp. TML/C7B]
MSSPTDPQPPAEPAVPAPPSTQEIPVAAPPVSAQTLPPHPGATTPSPVQTVQPTGPVGLVPGLPGALPPIPPPAPVPAATGPVPPVAEDPAVEELPSAVTREAPASEAPTEVVADAPATPRDRSALIGLGLVAASLLALELGLGLRFGGESFWSDIPLWSAFATVCAVLGLAVSAALLPGSRRPSAASSWRIAAGGVVGLAVFWVLVVLPVVATDRGFLLTAALGLLGAAVWTGPARTG